MVKIEELDQKGKKKEKNDEKAIPTTSNRTQDKVDQFNDLFQTMQEAVDENPKRDSNSLLGQAIELALAQGRGWGPGEKEAYLERILADDFIPPLFANTQVEVEHSGLQPAFTTLIYDDESPTNLMTSFKKKGNDAFANGKRNVVKNMQYYRDAINFWLEALAWAEKIRPFNEQSVDDDPDQQHHAADEGTYTQVELSKIKATLSANIAQAHLQLSNWGLCRDHATIAVTRYDGTNVKAWYRLAQAQQRLQQWEEAGEAIERGLAVVATTTTTSSMNGSAERKELIKLQTALADRVRRARQLRQERERKRAERVARVKAVWKHCQQNKYTLGKVPLVASATDDGDDDDEDNLESLWHNHLPHSGMLPSQDDGSPGNDWSWPCLFVYPSHQQSDFIANFGESEMLAMRMAEVFPELDDDEGDHPTTRMPWDTDNQFTCSNLVVYFEVYEAALEQKQHQRKQQTISGSNDKDETHVLVHPEAVQYIGDQATCMRFYEAARALKGDEGADIAHVVRLAAQGQLQQHQRRYKQRHGSLWAGRPAAAPVVQVHPAVTLRQVLADPRMVVPNFLVTFILFPETHPAHRAYLQEHRCMGVLHPEPTEES